MRSPLDSNRFERSAEVFRSSGIIGGGKIARRVIRARSVEQGISRGGFQTEEFSLGWCGCRREKVVEDIECAVASFLRDMQKACLKIET